MTIISRAATPNIEERKSIIRNTLVSKLNAANIPIVDLGRLPIEQLYKGKEEIRHDRFPTRIRIDSNFYSRVINNERQRIELLTITWGDRYYAFDRKTRTTVEPLRGFNIDKIFNRLLPYIQGSIKHELDKLKHQEYRNKAEKARRYLRGLLKEDERSLISISNRYGYGYSQEEYSDDFIELTFNNLTKTQAEMLIDRARHIRELAEIDYGDQNEANHSEEEDDEDDDY